MSHTMTNCTGSPARPGFRALLFGPMSVRSGRPMAGLMLTSFAALALAGVAAGGDLHHSNPWLLTWIPPSCCVTNDCCWEVTERELRPLADDKWEVRSTGQVRWRTDWSPDGKFYRCACDYDSASNRWIKHQGAYTRCIFVPMRTAGVY